MKTSPELEYASIVLLGSFNPAIFQPAWLAAHGLIHSDDQGAPKATLKVVHPEVTDFVTDDFQLQVVQQRLLLRALNASFYSSLKDLALGMFQILRHTPVAKMGINREIHYKMPDEASWHAVGDRLAPKASWSPLLEAPKLLRLDMKGARPDNHRGHLQVRVEGSKAVRPFGISVEVNDHYEVGGEEPQQGCGELMSILETEWDGSLKRSEAIAAGVVFGEEVARA